MSHGASNVRPTHVYRDSRGIAHRVHRITLPSTGTIESTVLVQHESDGFITRVPARKLIWI